MTTLQERLRNPKSLGIDLQNTALEAAGRIDALEAKLDQYRTEYFQTLRERDALRANNKELLDQRLALMDDKAVLLGHMETIRNCTNDPAISNLAKVVLERMAQGEIK